MKILNIEGENLLNEFRNFNEIFRKDVTSDNIKSHKKPVLHPFSEIQIFGKTTESNSPSSLFTVNKGKSFFLEVSFKANRKSIGFSKKQYQEFSKSGDEILIVFNTLTLQQFLWIMKTFVKKLAHHFLVESTKTENALCPYKPVMSETNIKTNRMGSTK